MYFKIDEKLNVYKIEEYQYVIYCAKMYTIPLRRSGGAKDEGRDSSHQLFRIANLVSRDHQYERLICRTPNEELK